ncbi:MAG: hypothetical protein WBA23_24795 [Tunicatimonas sp.]|uniref:hypothetical protein n=1 Tax=Tunicatimonas sp. TaxID=1940096 RepID=UPI003C7481E2
MKITCLIFLLFLIKPFTTNATEFNARSFDPLTTEDSLDYINDKLFNGVCSVESNAGHAFCLDKIEFSSTDMASSVLALREDHKQLNQDNSILNAKIKFQTQPDKTPQKYKYVQHRHYNSDSVEGGLKFPLYW